MNADQRGLERGRMNYLKATNLRVCLLVNFAKAKLEVRRIANNY